MQVTEYIQRQVAAGHRTVAGVLSDLTEDQLNWVPQGTANTIGAVLLHFTAGEDTFIQTFIQGKPLLFETQGWSDRVGIRPPSIREDWRYVREHRLKVEPLAEYLKAVQAATVEYLNGLTEEELSRTVKAFGGERQVADVLTVLVAHCCEHAGEIAALKGIQGAKGMQI